MPIDHNTLQEILYKAFPGSELEIIDLVGDSNHYKVTITSDRFNDLSLKEQHKLVYAALGDIMGGELHAMSLVTKKKLM